MVGWANEETSPDQRVWSIEGAGSYGAGLCATFAPAIAEVVDVVDKPAGRVVHLRLLPGVIEDDQATPPIVTASRPRDRRSPAGGGRPAGSPPVPPPPRR